MLAVLRDELGRGLAYRQIRHPNARLFTDWLPAAIAAAMLVALLSLPVRPVLLGKDGLFAGAMSVLSTLPGFYFAGLAAVATFSNAYMDREMPAPAPEIEIVVAGQRVTNKLTRRQYLSYLFSYLVFLALLLCFLLLGLNAALGTIGFWKVGLLGQPHGTLLWAVIRLFGLVPIAYLFASLLVTTLQGVFFLSERIHQP